MLRKLFKDYNGFRTEHLLILPSKENNTFDVFKIPKEARSVKTEELATYIKIKGKLPENGKIRLREKYYTVEVKKHAEEAKFLSDVLKEYGIEYYAEFF